MRNKINTFYLFLFSLLFFVVSSYCSYGGNGSRDAYTRIGVAPVIGFYKLDTKHASTPRSRMSFSGFIKREWSIDRSNQLFISIGGEYFLHGLSAKTYYFDQDTLQLYTGEFNYSYKLYFTEVNLPIQAKFTFKSTTNSLVTPYFTAGYHLRYITSTSLKVEQEGALIKSDFVDTKFKNPFILNQMNSFIGLCFGLQNNRTRSNSITFFAEASFKYGFSPYSFKEKYSPSSLYINSTHLALNIGVGF
ncbi:MAG: hypothetical protein ACK50A_14580 [Sphingobacteriaceae bacterium]